MTRKQGRFRVMDLNLNEDITDYHTMNIDMSFTIRFRYHMNFNYLKPCDRRWDGLIINV